jgi:hypothetical protein
VTAGGAAGVACTHEADTVFCTRLTKNCGSVTANDNCGTSRTVASCGPCNAPQTCTANVCIACVAESNAAFCTRLTKNCGNVTAADNCGTSKTVACGTCNAPQVCTANVCAACVAESNAAFCARLGKNCGNVTQADNCGTSKTVACGPCTGTDVCGTSNVCAPSGCNLSPYGGTARTIPGTIQFEDYDVGTGGTSPNIGLGCSYNDSTSGNAGTAYRTTEGVDIEGCSEGGYDVGYNNVAEWLKYTVAVTGATHNFSFRVSCASGDATTCPGAFHVESETNPNLIPAVTIPGTANGQTYTTVVVTGVALPAGTHTLKIVIDALLHTVNLNWFSAT